MATTKKQLQYIVVPHPDDEFSAWSLIEGAADNYSVFVLLTHGEATTLADGHGLQSHLGERIPQPQPFHGGHSLYIRAQRLDSWHAFLDGMAAFDSTLDTPAFRVHLTGDADGVPVRSTEFDVFVGDSTARVVFDLGDGRVSAEAVGWALRAVRSQVRPLLPLQREYGVIGAAYYNANYPGPRYTHPDHLAVHRALWNIDFALPGPQWGRTTHSDPDARPPHGRTNAITASTYDAAMAVDPDGRRRGLFQQVYGWLAFDPSGYFPPAAGESDDGGSSRVQTFWQRF